jgi:undecaprenyl-diphosphatase
MIKTRGIMKNRLNNNIRIYFLILALIQSLLLILISYAVNKDLFRSIDYRMMTFLQSAIDQKFDKVLSLFTVIGSSEITILILMVILLIIYFKHKYFFTGLALFVSIFVIELMGKFLIFHPGPPAIFNRYALPIKFPSSFIVHTVSSYPSGHMARGAFVGIIILLLLLKSKFKTNKRIIYVILILLLISGMFISRIYLGEHWFSDVLGGLLLGSTIAFLSFCFW